MIRKIRLVNFRNFSSLSLSDLSLRNFIIWENGKGKTNILEALSLLCGNSLTGIPLEHLVKQWEESFFIEMTDSEVWELSFSYEKETKNKKYILNKKPSTKKKFLETTHRCVCFSPIIMNLLYLSPSLRRDFLDNILSHCFPEYNQELLAYKKIVKHRNKVLKNIAEGKSQRDEINFWNDKFCHSATFLYAYRFKLSDFFQDSIHKSLEYFGDKIETIAFIYNHKVEKDNIFESIKKYLETNRERDVILGKTPIWLHVDDFEIQTDGMNITQFASRWETKSVILWIKLMESVFIEKMTNKKPLLLIDDLLSELDHDHESMLLKKLQYYQVFISSIESIDPKKDIKI